MKTSTKVVLGIIVLAAVVAIFYSSRAPAEPGKYDALAQCITDSGAKMYGAYSCPHCTNQKKLFGTSFDKINYVECDPRGDNANPQACEKAGIEGYPTWIFGDGTRRSGEVPLRTLASITGCAVPE